MHQNHEKGNIVRIDVPKGVNFFKRSKFIGVDGREYQAYQAKPAEKGVKKRGEMAGVCEVIRDESNRIIQLIHLCDAPDQSKLDLNIDSRTKRVEERREIIKRLVQAYLYQKTSNQ